MDHYYHLSLLLTAIILIVGVWFIAIYELVAMIIRPLVGFNAQTG